MSEYAKLSREELESRIAALTKNLPSRVQSDIARQAADALSEGDREAKRAVLKSLNQKNVYYAIRKQDLSFAEEAVVIASGMAGALANPIPIIGALVVLLLRYRRQRIRLNGDQGIVLHILKRAPDGGWTVAEVLGNLPRGCTLNAAQVGSVLQSLLAVRGKGGNVALVSEYEGRWEAEDV